MALPRAGTCARPPGSRYDRGLMPYRAGVQRRWTVRRRSRLVRFAGSLIASPLLLAAAGCGSAHPASSGAGPARTVPASVAMYAEAAVRPQGSLKKAARAEARPATYRGVSVRVTADGVGFGVVDRLLVIGSESALHGVIDTSLGQPSLARSGTYSRLVASGPEEALAHLYLSGSAAPPS